MASLDRVLAGARLIESSPGSVSRHVVQRPSHRLSLRGVQGDVAVRILESVGEARPELGFLERKFYFLVRVDFIDGAGSGYVAVNRRSASNFLVANGVKGTQDVAADFWNLEMIKNNRTWFEVVSPAEWDIRGDEYDDVVRISQDLNRDVKGVIQEYKKVPRDIRPHFMDSFERTQFFKKQIVAQILRVHAFSKGIDYETQVSPCLESILECVAPYHLSLEQIADCLPRVFFYGRPCKSKGVRQAIVSHLMSS